MSQLDGGVSITGQFAPFRVRHGFPLVRQSQDYQALTDTLRRAGALTEVAEVHGSLCAVLCVAGSSGTELWREDSLEGAESANAQLPMARSALEHMELDTWAALNGSAMDFMPLLPDDSADLVERADALACWCQGFLYGVTLSGVTQAPSEATGAEHFDEFVGDLAEISKAGIGANDDVVEADFAYAELVEFVRGGVQLLFEELAIFRSQLVSSGSLH